MIYNVHGDVTFGAKAWLHFSCLPTGPKDMIDHPHNQMEHFSTAVASMSRKTLNTVALMG